MDIDPEVNLDIGDNTYFGPLNTEPNAKIVFHFWYDEGQHFTHIHDDKMRFNTSKFKLQNYKNYLHFFKDFDVIIVYA